MSDRLISKIRITKLFGLYSYILPEDNTFSNATILYGDNGVGKSTILMLAFHLLSAASDKGHRTALYKAKFESLEVDLVSGHTLSAKFRKDGSNNILSLSIRLKSETLVVWDYLPINKSKYSDFNESDEVIFEIGMDGKPIVTRRKHSKRYEETATARGEQAYITTLKTIVPTTFILNADRRLDSDSVSDPSDEIELRRMMHFEDALRINDLVSRSREIALSQALNAAGRWIGKKAVQSANQGTENVHSVYGNVLRHLVTPSKSQTQLTEETDISGLVKQLTSIETKTAELARYELATPLLTSEFKKALNTKSKPKRTLAANLLKPYIESLESRLKAIEPIYKLIDKFMTIVNDLLSDKSMSFKLSQGFSFKNRVGEILEPAYLSSGEQQLLLLFCYVLVARDNPSVFMIDEPEISLNIKWQRQLIQALLEITNESRIQFIFASHSLELLSQHRNRVVKLTNQT